MDNQFIPWATESKKQSPSPAASPITKPLETTKAPWEFRSVFFSKIVQIVNISTSGKHSINYLQFWQPWYCLIPADFQKCNLKYLHEQWIWRKFLIISSPHFPTLQMVRPIPDFLAAQVCRYGCPSLLDLHKQISNTHINCTWVWNCWQVSEISSCYL